MKSFAAAVVAMMASSAVAFAPSASQSAATSMEAMPDRMWDEMVDKTERSASLPWLPRPKALDGSMAGDVGCRARAWRPKDAGRGCGVDCLPAPRSDGGQAKRFNRVGS